MPFRADSLGPTMHVLDGVHIVATWRIRMNGTCARRCGLMSNDFDHSVHSLLLHKNNEQNGAFTAV